MDVNVFSEIQQQNVQRLSDGSKNFLRSLRDGALVEANWIDALALEGRIFGANFGSAGTGIAGHTAFTAAQPDANIDVPPGTAIIPLYANVFFHTSAGTVNEVTILASQNLMGNGTSSAATAGPLPWRLDKPLGSNCVCRQAYTVNGNTQTNPLELYKSGYEFADATGAPVKQFTWIPPVRPVIVGTAGASLSLYWNATTTAASAYAQVVWAELPASAIQ